MTEESAAENRSLLLAALLVLLWPQAMWHGARVTAGWPVAREMPEIMIFLIFIIVTAVVTLLFLTYIEIDAKTFVYLGVFGPIVSLFTPVILTPSGGFHPAFLVLASIFVAGFLLGFTAHRYHWRR